MGANNPGGRAFSWLRLTVLIAAVFLTGWCGQAILFRSGPQLRPPVRLTPLQTATATEALPPLPAYLTRLSAVRGDVHRYLFTPSNLVGSDLVAQVRELGRVLPEALAEAESLNMPVPASEKAALETFHGEFADALEQYARVEAAHSLMQLKMLGCALPPPSGASPAMACPDEKAVNDLKLSYYSSRALLQASLATIDREGWQPFFARCDFPLLLLDMQPQATPGAAPAQSLEPTR